MPSSATPREYELVLMLDPEIPDERREQIASEARKRIESGGNLKDDTAWGMRKLAYEIRQRTEADYRFFRFETDGGLLDELNHNLRIADGVLRFRLFKVDAGSPAVVPPPAMSPPSGPPARAPRRQQGAPEPESAAPTEEAEEAPAAPEPPAEEAAEAPAVAEPPAEEAPAAAEPPAEAVEEAPAQAEPAEEPPAPAEPEPEGDE